VKWDPGVLAETGHRTVAWELIPFVAL